MKIDFVAKEEHYVDHMLPIWMALREQRGQFQVPKQLEIYVNDRNGMAEKIDYNHNNPVVVASHQDIQSVYMNNPKRTIIMMEHGAINFFPGNPSYVGNYGYRTKASLTLAPNQMMAEQTAKALPDMKQRIVGTPKLDEWLDVFDGKRAIPQKPIVCISFHWDGRHVAPEAGNAFEYYKDWVIALNKNYWFRLVAHGHPRGKVLMRSFYEHHNIHYIDDFAEVMETADVYVNDCSSTLFEFLVTGKPVVLLNRPDWRRDVDYGARFWRYADVGMQVDNGKDLLGAILNTMWEPNQRKLERRKAVQDLYPFLGRSADLAAATIIDHISKLEEKNAEL